MNLVIHFEFLGNVCKVPGRGGSRNWLCLFMLTMPLSIIGIALAAAIEIYTGGPFPTDAYDTGSKVYYAGHVIGIFFSVVAITIIVRVIRDRIIAGVALAGMFLSFTMMLACIGYLAQVPNGKDISMYTQKYYKDEKEPPPFLDFTQRVTRKLGDFACCGGEGFDDYAVVSKRWVPGTNVKGKTYNETGYYVFDAPDSCCKGNKTSKEKDCGKNLIYFFHKIEYTIITEALKIVTNVKQIPAEVRKRAMEKIKKQDEDMKNSPKPMMMNGELFTAAQMEEIAKANLDRLREYNESSETEVKISVLGCGRIFDEFREGRIQHMWTEQTKNLPTVLNGILAFAILVTLLDGATIGIFVCYFFRFNYPPFPVNPIYPDGGENGGAFEGVASLSEGVGHPRMDPGDQNDETAVDADGQVEKPVTPPTTPPLPQNP